MGRDEIKEREDECNPSFDLSAMGPGILQSVGEAVNPTRDLFQNRQSWICRGESFSTQVLSIGAHPSIG